MKDCLFCKIIDGDIPSYKVYEDKYVLAFLDISQGTLGHLLVLPKKHFANILEINKKYLHKVMDVVAKLAQAVNKLEGVKGVNILNNCNEAAGQTVMHFHVHVIPRYDERELNLEFKNPHKLNEEEFNNIKNSIIKNLDN